MKKKPYHFKPTDKILVSIYALNKLGWNKLELSSLFGISERTVTTYITKGYDKLSTINLPDFAKSERPRIQYVGNTTDLDYINAKEHQRPTGGGTRKVPHKYNDNWEME